MKQPKRSDINTKVVTQGEVVFIIKNYCSVFRYTLI
jgi:hypothetical protein